MRCPECRSEHYFEGLLGVNCARRGCPRFRNGKVIGVDLSVPDSDCIGWVWPGTGATFPKEDYIFKSEQDALKWVTGIGIHHFANGAYQVEAMAPIRWMDDPRGFGATMGEHLYVICSTLDNKGPWPNKTFEYYALLK